MTQNSPLQSTRNWVTTVVIDLNLCPFARQELNANRVHFSLSEADTDTQLLDDLHSEILRLDQNSHIETTLLVHPHALQDFSEYNQFLELADALLQQMNFEGIYQIASFHPEYQFADTGTDDVSNYTNRSPYPMLHLIREQSLEKAVAAYPDAEQIPNRNIALLEQMGHAKVLALWHACFAPPSLRRNKPCS